MKDPLKQKPYLRFLNILIALLIALGTIAFMLWDKKIPQGETSEQETSKQASSEKTTAHGDQALFRVGERYYHFSDLPAEFREPLYQIRKLAHQQQMLVLEEALVDSYLAQETAATGKSPEALLAERFAGSTPDEAALRRFYEQNRQADTPPFEQIRDDIAAHLKEQSQQNYKKRLLGDLLINREAEMLIEAPRRPEASN